MVTALLLLATLAMLLALEIGYQSLNLKEYDSLRKPEKEISKQSSVKQSTWPKA